MTARRYRCTTCGNETYFDRRFYFDRSKLKPDGSPRSYSFLVCECESRQVRCIQGEPSKIRIQDFRGAA